ncbi:hypothetical protein BD769DRAFT_1465284 [Suillus cothurnatus]|jgi:hypothetical protein|nr:hypothetical protein BD769DRAFT_1465284 [Suillus cothurnatus]
MLFPLALVPVPAIGFASVRALKPVLVVSFVLVITYKSVLVFGPEQVRQLLGVPVGRKACLKNNLDNRPCIFLFR